MTRHPFDPTELGPLSDDLVALARELESYAHDLSPAAPVDLVGRVMEAVSGEAVPMPPVRARRWHAVGVLVEAWRAVCAALGRHGAVGPAARARAVAILLVAALIVTVAGAGVALGAPALARLFAGPGTPVATHRLTLPAETPRESRPIRTPMPLVTRSPTVAPSVEPDERPVPSGTRNGEPDGTSEPSETPEASATSEPTDGPDPGDTRAPAHTDSDPTATAADR